MEDKRSPGMKEQRLRRQRINRMKKMIVAVMSFGFLSAIALCIGLTVQVVRLNQRIDALTEERILVQESGQPENPVSVLAGGDTIQSKALDEVSVSEKQKDSAAGEDPEAENAPQEDAKSPAAKQEPSRMDNPSEEDTAKKVYLTFDDGPSQVNTAAILDILKEKNVKATFFVIGNDNDYAPDLYRRIVEEGHTLGMHSYTHKYSSIYDSLEAFQEDFYRLRGYLGEITGVEPDIMRFPGGSSNSVSNIDMRECIRFLNEEGITYYDWNVISGDATSQVYTADELIDNVMKDVAKNQTSIVLMHDAETKATTVEALGPMIDQLQEMGCELLPIDENTKVIQHISADQID